MDFVSLWLTLKLALISTTILMIFSVPISWFLVRSKSKFTVFLDTIISIPLVLPPTVLGFYLLVFLGKNGPLNKVYDFFDINGFAFSFEGLIIGSIIYSLPFVVRPIQNALFNTNFILIDVAETLGDSRYKAIFKTVFPQIRRSLLSAFSLGFAHVVGEFGVVLMIGGNIPGETKVLSISIYEQVELLNYSSAHLMSATLVIFSFLTLFLVQYLDRKGNGVIR